MKIKMIALSVALVASANAGEIAGSQWKLAPGLSLLDLVHGGYKIVAAVKDDDTQESFFLQNDKSVYMCQEKQVTNSSFKNFSSFSCAELVKPFAVHPSK